MAAGAAAAAFKSYANGNYAAMGSFDWKHLASDAAYLASTQIPGLSKYADQLQQLAENAAQDFTAGWGGQYAPTWAGVAGAAAGNVYSEVTCPIWSGQCG